MGFSRIPRGEKRGKNSGLATEGMEVGQLPGLKPVLMENRVLGVIAMTEDATIALINLI